MRWLGLGVRGASLGLPGRVFLSDLIGAEDKLKMAHLVTCC